MDVFYVHAASARLDDRARVLKHNDTFAVFDRYGDVRSAVQPQEGLYHHGTRHLSRADLSIDGRRPLFLSSTVRRDHPLLTVHLMNPDLEDMQPMPLARGVVHVLREKLLWAGACLERIHVTNFEPAAVAFELAFEYEADFVDVFEVRGTRRERRGQLFPPAVDGATLRFAYRGLDQVERRTHVTATPAPTTAEPGALRFAVDLAPKATVRFDVVITCDPAEAPSAGFSAALSAAGSSASRVCPRITSTNLEVDEWIERSRADIDMMTTRTPQGPYPYAGVPWFSTPFGRDGVITALERLWIDPALARGVLGFLAATQATTTNPERDAEPGKILHEARDGEMAALGEVPFARYYGSVDVTPLFVVLAGAYYERTGDLPFVEGLWPHVEAALAWIDGAMGGPDAVAGFLSYACQSTRGLTNQGWKDSHDSVFHADGALADGPIALCEVQGYVHLARRRAAELATALGDRARAAALTAAAADLRARFCTRFWCEELSTYALALDGAARPCRVITSNPGHCLFAGIATPAHARRIARTLLEPASFSGWGIRTVATRERRYNPMAYHDGSVWPHDNALVAWGLARYGFKDAAVRVLDALFHASLFFDLRRMPELFCGFERRGGEGPTLYPVACTPQSWAAGAVFLLLQACLGLSIKAARREIRFDRPVLPAYLGRLAVEGLQVGDASVDLAIEGHGADVAIDVSRRDGRVGLVVVK